MRVGDGGIDPVGLIAHQRFAGKFQEDAAVGGLGARSRTRTRNYTGDDGAAHAADGRRHGCTRSSCSGAPIVRAAVTERRGTLRDRRVYSREFAQLEAGEARDGDVLAGLGRRRSATICLMLTFGSRTDGWSSRQTCA